MEKVVIDNQEYNVIVERKPFNKRMYVRLKDNLEFHVTCNNFISTREIIRFINDNSESFRKMIERVKKKLEKEQNFYYLGKKYDVIRLNNNQITLGKDKVFIGNNIDINKWYQIKARTLFQNELDKMYHNFKYPIPYPSLTIRKMTSRWGVCNTKTHRVTLNLELIKRTIEELDYVIVHELSHLLYPNHSKEFWKCVEENFNNYKKIRKELKNYE